MGCELPVKIQLASELKSTIFLLSSGKPSMLVAPFWPGAAHIMSFRSIGTHVNGGPRPQ